MTSAAANLDKVFAMLEQAAIAGSRCPENGCHGVSSATIHKLARTGRIRVEISGHNWRQITILAGEHAGKATAPNEFGSKPWKIIDSTGTRINGKLVNSDAGKRSLPSMPRLLSHDEIFR